MISWAIWPNYTDTSTGHCRTPTSTRLSTPSQPASHRSTSGRSARPSASSTWQVCRLTSRSHRWDVCFASIMRPAAQEMIKELMDRGFHKPGDVENRLGYHVGQLG